MKRKLLADGGGAGGAGGGDGSERNHFVRNVQHIEGNWAGTVYLTGKL